MYVLNFDTPMLEIDQISLRFGSLQALDKLSLSIQRGETIGLVGANGAGKSSLFNCISGHYVPEAGQIRWEGKEIQGKGPAEMAQLGIGRSFQQPRLWGKQTVWEHAEVARQRFWPHTWRYAIWPPPQPERLKEKEKLHHWIEQLGLSPYKDLPADALPYALQKRVDLLRTLVWEPKLLLLDEPGAGLSEPALSELKETLHTWKGERSLLIVDHHIELLRGLCDRILVLEAGAIVANGSWEEVRERSDYFQER